jgi:hypothetical protein
VADLTLGTGVDRDRAQLILIAAFALAVVLVALALVMNAAIYTENLATRSEAVGLSNAHAAQRATTNVAVEALAYAHEIDNATEHKDIEANVTAAIEGYNNVSRRQHASTGHVVNASLVSATYGTNISGGDGDDFTADDPTVEIWDVTRDASTVREFSMDVDTSTLADHGAGTDEFRVVARDGGQRWFFNVSKDPSVSNRAIVGINDTETYSECVATSSEFTINVSAGTVGGSDCPALDLDDTPNTFDLEFRNASAIRGDYELIVDRDEDGRAEFTNDGPRARPVLFSIEVEFVYQSPDLDYETRIRIAPWRENA